MRWVHGKRSREMLLCVMMRHTGLYIPVWEGCAGCHTAHRRGKGKTTKATRQGCQDMQTKTTPQTAVACTGCVRMDTGVEWNHAQPHRVPDVWIGGLVDTGKRKRHTPGKKNQDNKGNPLQEGKQELNARKYRKRSGKGTKNLQ